VESALSLGHPRARDDIGAIAARDQDALQGKNLVETLVPFQMVYADGIERLACESLVERQRWVNRLWYVPNLVAMALSDRSLGRQSINQLLVFDPDPLLVLSGQFFRWKVRAVSAHIRAQALDQQSTFRR
jgi:hypothetical protein